MKTETQIKTMRDWHQNEQLNLIRRREMETDYYKRERLTYDIETERKILATLNSILEEPVSNAKARTENIVGSNTSRNDPGWHPCANIH